MELSNYKPTEIDIQISTAKTYPRNVVKFRQTAEAMATSDQATAESCFYSLPRKDANGNWVSIQGPSIRLAEIVAASWGNLKFASRIIEENDKFIVAEGAAFDMENNIHVTSQIRKKITNKNGNRYSDDMIANTANAACSIALRNAIFKVIPMTYVTQIFEKTKQVAIGNVKNIDTRKAKMFAQFLKIGVTQEQILIRLQLESVDKIGLNEIETLLGYYNSITQGEDTIENIFNLEEHAKNGVRAKTNQEPTVNSASKTEKSENAFTEEFPTAKFMNIDSQTSTTAREVVNAKSGWTLAQFTALYSDAKKYLGREKVDSILKSVNLLNIFPSRYTQDQLNSACNIINEELSNANV